MNRELCILKEQHDLFTESADKNLDRLHEINEKHFKKLLSLPDFLAIIFLSTKKYRRIYTEWELTFARFINEINVLQTLKK